MWGVAAQVYSLRRAGDGGIGDAGAVRELAEAAAGTAPTPWRSAPCTACSRTIRRARPYSPSSRLFLNPLYADPSATFDATAVAVRRRLERADLIDWAPPVPPSSPACARLFEEFDQVDTPLLREFERSSSRAARRWPARPLRGRAGAPMERQAAPTAFTSSCNGSPPAPSRRRNGRPGRPACVSAF
jgi:4-alpha-glucanotransferase